MSFGIAQSNEPLFGIPPAMTSPFESDVDGPLRNRKVMGPGDPGCQVMGTVVPAWSGADPSGLMIALGLF